MLYFNCMLHLNQYYTYNTYIRLHLELLIEEAFYYMHVVCM